ncbi:helix-turn-helix domain-containing protein [Sphingomonas sp. MMS12-HWE2-04]|uniref:helix-turn-helix domain-containing protein n=1 Tax=Sphingomonas sp. MMS12-HWE2-04 TaxID=3234199 RepID=UPI00384F22F9
MARTKSKGQPPTGATARAEVVVDLHRTFVFPNRMREQRRAQGYQKLLRLAASIPEIPYIRLSKIERGEVVARPDELRRIAAVLGVAPLDLLLDIDAADYDVARWAEPFRDGFPVDVEEERFAVLLAAALRARRAGDPALTIAAIERDYGLPPVNLSRIENAQKVLPRWNAATLRALFSLFGVPDAAALRVHVEARYRSGALDMLVGTIASPEARHARSRTRIADIAAVLAEPGAVPVAAEPAQIAPVAQVLPVAKRVPVLGTPLPAGLVSDTPTGETVEPPSAAGPHAFALRVCRATLGAGLPAKATVIVDPDRFPAPGGLAALREEAGWRLLSVGSARDGRMIGYSCNPELEFLLDDVDPSRVAAVTAALFV